LKLKNGLEQKMPYETDGRSAQAGTRHEDTPAKLKRLQLVSIVIAAFFAACTMFTYVENRHAVQTVAVDAAPSVFAAHEIKNHVLNMDADAANYLAARPGENMLAAKDYEKWRTQIVEQLVTAAKNITYGEAEEAPIRSLNDGLARYQVAIQAAKDLHERGDPAFMARYREAYGVLSKTILPAASELDRVNTEVLRSTYDRQTFISSLMLGFTVTSGMALIAWTVYAQLYMRHRFRRRFSGYLVAAIGLASVFLLYSTAMTIQEKRHLRIAKEDAYDSVVHLMDSRASALDANAALSRWLLDSPMKPMHQKAFEVRVAEIGAISGRSSYEQVATAALATGSVAGMTGSLADALGNITFPGEREALLEALKWWGTYMGIDNLVRATEAGNMHADAVAMSIGTDTDQSQWAFKKFDAALNNALKINRDQFDANVANAFSDISLIWELSIIQALMQALLFYLAVRARHREFPV
jgi:hypothetical protein